MTTHLIKSTIDLIQKRPHSKTHLNAILSKYTGHALLDELQRYLDTLAEAESRAANYAFYNKYWKNKKDDSAEWDKLEKELFKD